MENFEDLYTDYLISSSSYTTATGVASLLSIKHDKITRELSKGDYDSRFLWKKVKPYIEELTRSKDTIVLSFDDSIWLIRFGLCHPFRSHCASDFGSNDANNNVLICAI